MTELPGYSEQPICVRRLGQQPSAQKRIIVPPPTITGKLTSGDIKVRRLGHPEESVPPENPFAVDFARNCQTAIANLRRRIAERGELPTNENDRGYIDPVTRILISGEGDRTSVAMRNKFSNLRVMSYAEGRLNLIYMAFGGDNYHPLEHEMLITKGILRNPEGVLFFEYYDPLRGRKKVVLEKQVAFEEFLRTNKHSQSQGRAARQYWEFLVGDSRSSQYRLYPSAGSPSTEIRSNDGSVGLCDQLMITFANGRYDLSLANDPELGRFITDDIDVPIQNDGISCEMFTMLAAFQRWLLKKPLNRSESLEKSIARRQLESDFGVKFPTRNEAIVQYGRLEEGVPSSRKIIVLPTPRKINVP